MQEFVKDLVFVGQAPSRETDGLPPFVGKCGKFLADLMGKTQEQMLEDHDFVNVLERWPGRGINGDKFPMPAAKTRVRELFPALRGKTVILLGSNVARAFGCTKFQYFTWYQMVNCDDLKDVVVQKMMVVPHPSGVNRWWNIPENRDIARKFLYQLSRSYGRGQANNP